MPCTHHSEKKSSKTISSSTIQRNTSGSSLNKVKWCIKKKAITLTEPNSNVSQAYFQSAQEDLTAMLKQEGKWKTITAYYACYNAFYALHEKKQKALPFRMRINAITPSSAFFVS